MQRIAPDKAAEMMNHVMLPYFEEGRQEGREEGREALAKAVLRVAEKRFPGVSSEVRERIVSASAATLEEWHDRLLDSPSLDAVFGSGQDREDIRVPPSIQQERQAALAEAVLVVVEKRFPPVPDKARKRIIAADEATLRGWLAQLIDAPALAQVFGNGESDAEEPHA